MKLWCRAMTMCSTSSSSASSESNERLAPDFTRKSDPILALCPFANRSPTPSSLLVSPRLDLELKDHEGSTALWLALQYITVASDPSVNPFEDHAPVENGTSFNENSFASRLIQRGSNPDAPDTATGADHGPPRGSKVNMTDRKSVV